jgi:hypothetical protein
VYGSELTWVRFGPTGFCGVDGIDGVEGAEGEVPEQEGSANDINMRQTIGKTRRGQGRPCCFLPWRDPGGADGDIEPSSRELGRSAMGGFSSLFSET